MLFCKLILNVLQSVVEPESLRLEACVFNRTVTIQLISWQ